MRRAQTWIRPARDKAMGDAERAERLFVRTEDLRGIVAAAGELPEMGVHLPWLRALAWSAESAAEALRTTLEGGEPRRLIRQGIDALNIAGACRVIGRDEMAGSRSGQRSLTPAARSGARE